MMRGGLLLVLTVPGSALGFTHTYKVWCPEDQPVQWMLGDCPIEDLTQEEVLFCITEAYSNWDEAACTEFQWEYAGVLEGECVGFESDGLNLWSLDDPDGELSGGVLGATLTWPSTRFAFEQDGMSYRCIDNADVVLNDGIHWVMDAAIEAGECEDGVSLEAVATHQVGHLMGMGHSCEETDTCNHQDYLEATMFWTTSECDTSPSSIDSDDIAGITALYGPYATFKCSHTLAPGEPDSLSLGVVPFELECQVVATTEEQIVRATFYWGDGSVSVVEEGDLVASHVYTEPGNYSIQVCTEGESVACGEWQYCSHRIGLVRACGLPEPEFTWERVQGRTVRLLNESDVSVYGCILAIQWDIFAPDGSLEASVAAWEPTYTFLEGGTYRVVLNLGGPAGTAAAELTIDVDESRGGCTHAPLGGWILALGGLGLGLRRRRRR